jgi:hypothetical protein
MKRYSLNVSKDVYVKLMDLRTKDLLKTGHAPTVDELLRKQLRLVALLPTSHKEENS